jgi:hypothetical protein
MDEENDYYVIENHNYTTDAYSSARVSSSVTPSGDDG